MRKSTECKKNKIKNLKVAGATLGTMLLLCITGVHLSKEHENYEFEYIVLEDGSIDREGTVSYEDICKHWRLIEKRLVTGENKLFIINKSPWMFGANDIRTGKKITNIPNYNSITQYDPTILNIKKLDQYLLAYDMIKGLYNSEDIDKLLSMIEADYEYQDDKELIKQ